ncbi:PDR/VanB family oxidoreductase [Granulosicoccaceae sp. 1_MG-2023]|nr:PDR/VanB family oxidoreductase [Granulosicoccaceae sp. 1_MG-2023]
MSGSYIEVQVEQCRQVAPAIKEFALKALDAPLPAFSPGSHVVVEMRDGQKTYRNPYSLLSDPRDPSAYRIAVRLQEQSRGGSRFMHERIAEGSRLRISPPANLFAPDWRARKHILLAGGVGITPFMSYLPELQRRNADFELHHLFRSSRTGAYDADLRQRLDGRYFAYDSARDKRCPVAELMAAQSPGTHIYICGPQSLIDAVYANAAQIGWPQEHIHVEAFAAPEPGEPFEAVLCKSGKTIQVGAEESLLEALEREHIEVPNLCRGGVCGQCVTGVRDGAIEHRDHFLSEREKSSGQCLMPCVSRAKGPKLELEI